MQQPQGGKTITKSARCGFVILVAPLALAIVCPRAFAEDPEASHAAQKENRWQFLIAPYFWMAGLEGKTTVRGIETNVNFSFSDVWENLDVKAVFLSGLRMTFTPGGNLA